MKKVILVLLFLLSLSFASQVYELHLMIHENDTVELLEFDIIDAGVSSFPSAGEDNYEFRILSDDTTPLFNNSFQMNFVAYRFRGPNSTAPDVVPLTQIEDYWRLPYFENATRIQLFHDGKKIFEHVLEKETESDQNICGLALILAILPMIAIMKRGIR